MDKKLAGLLGAVGAFAAAASAQAATAGAPGIEEAMRADTYADLLKPIPNATALLRVSDAAAAEAPARLMHVQYYHHHHHHHHHHRYYRPRYYPQRVFHRHHHHHHRYHQPRGLGIIIR